MAITLDGTNGVTTPDLTVDTTTITVDPSNNRVGIGTASPSYTLHSTTSTGSDYAGFFHNGAGSGNGTALVAKGGANNAGAGTFIVQDYGGNEDFKVDGLGVVTKPNQPYFEACFDTSGWTAFAKSGTWVKMEMDATLTNVGNHYDTTNTRFVAPVAGKYFFSASIFLNVTWNSSTPYLSYLGFYKNNAFFSHFGQDVQSTEHIRHGIIMPLAANDYVDVRIQQAQAPGTNQYYKQANGRNYTYFHGMLIG